MDRKSNRRGRGKAIHRMVGVLLVCWLLLLTGAESRADDAVNVYGLEVPETLAKIVGRGSGSACPEAVFVIGESHVALPVQRRVARLIGYLYSAFDVRQVFIEGHSGPLELSALLEQLPLEDRRALADMELEGRRISGVGHAQLCFPDLSVVGIEDMDAYRVHENAAERELEVLEVQARALDEAIEEALAQVQEASKTAVTGKDVLVQAIARYNAEPDLEVLAGKSKEVLGADAPLTLRIDELAQQWQDLMREGTELATVSEAFARRDAAMAENIAAFWSERCGYAAVVVGERHLATLGEHLEETEVAYVGVLIRGADDDIDPSLIDQGIYDNWRAGARTGLEAATRQFRPQPPLARKRLQEILALKGILLMIDRRHLIDRSAPSTVHRNFRLPPGVELIDIDTVAGGTRIAFEEDGERYFALFGPAVDAVAYPEGRAVEAGRSGGRFYAIYPGNVSGGGGSGSGPPDPLRGLLGDDDLGRWRSVLATAREKNPKMALVQYPSHDGRLYRIVGDDVYPLNADARTVQDLSQQLLQDPAPGDQLLLATELSRHLLPGIDSQLPREARQLLLVADDSLLGPLSLPDLARISGISGADRFSQIADVANVPRAALHTGLLERIVAWQVPPADADRTAILVDDNVRQEPMYRAIEMRLLESGASVNSIGPDVRDLILVGQGIDQHWRFSLADGAVIEPGTAIAQQRFAYIEQVVAYDMDLPQSLKDVNRASVVRLDDVFQSLQAAVEDAEAVVNAENEGKTLDQARREQVRSTEAEVKDLLSGRARSAAGTARATQQLRRIFRAQMARS